MSWKFYVKETPLKMSAYNANRHQIFQVPLQLKSGHAWSKSQDIYDLVCVRWRQNSTPREKLRPTAWKRVCGRVCRSGSGSGSPSSPPRTRRRVSRRPLGTTLRIGRTVWGSTARCSLFLHGQKGYEHEQRNATGICACLSDNASWIMLIRLRAVW